MQCVADLELDNLEGPTERAGIEDSGEARMMDAKGGSSLLQLAMNTTDPGSTCKREVLDMEQALFCDICEWWEHLDCIRVNDKLSQQCYNALIESRCNSIVFMLLAQGYPSA